MIEEAKGQEIPQESPTDRAGQGQKSTILSIDKERASHIVLSVLCILLIVFSVASAIGLLAVSATNSKISSAKGTTAMLMLVAGIISLVAVGAVLMSWKKVTWYLHMYEFACLVVLVLLVLVLIGTAMTNSNSASSTATCTSPTNYFQYEMYNVALNGANLLCSANCPCPKYNQVQLCPGWIATPADSIMQQLQIQFKCSGWCQTNPNANFLFSGVDNSTNAVGGCYMEWSKWVSSQWNSIMGCISTIVVILFFNILSANWRILKICNKDQ